MTNRLISLTVGTEGAEEWYRTFQDLSELATNLGAVHQYVSIASSAIEEDDEDDAASNHDPEGLYYDEYTMIKVYKTLEDYTTRPEDIINSLLNAGILFRERPKKHE